MFNVVSKSSLLGITFSLVLSELTIGFEQASYTAQEGTPLEVCAVILEGSVERTSSVPFTFGAQPGTAGEGYDITDVYQVYLFVAVYPTAFVWQMDT